MKTIVINTSDVLKKTELDIMFRAPYNPEELIWSNMELNQIGSFANEIKSLLTGKDVLSSLYNLFVIVDMFDFPFAEITEYSEQYQKFLKKYISSELLSVLVDKYNLPPQKANICFLNDETFADNADEGRHNEVFVRFLEDSFKWTSIDRWESVNWTFRYSRNKELYLDFSKTFSCIKDSKHDENVDLFEILKQQISDVLMSKDSYVFSVDNFCFEICHDNDADLFKDFFIFLANIFRWIKNNKIDEIKEYSLEEIKKLMMNGRLKFEYYTKEENYKNVEYFTLSILANSSNSAIKAKWKENRRSVLKSYVPTASPLTSIYDKKNASEISKKERGLSARFSEIKNSILRNYDAAILAEENKNIIISNIDKTQFYRKKVSEKDFVQVVENSFEADKLKVNTREYLGHTDFGENGYNELIAKITQAEIDFFGNDNILYEVEKAQVEFDDLTRKGKWGLVSLIGGILSFLAAMYPFLEIRSNIKLYREVDFLFILPVLGVAAALYVLSANIYTAHIHRKKLGVIHALELLKGKSEESREKSKAAFVDFCEKTLPEAELYLLISRELKRRDEENAKTAKRLNNHIKRFRYLNELMQNFFTKMRLDYVNNVSYEDNELENDYPAIDVGKDFYDENNAKAYCIIDFDGVDRKKNKSADVAGV